MAQSSPLDTIFLPFSDGHITWPDRSLFVGAQYHPALRDVPGLSAWQIFKPFADNLSAHGIASTPAWPGQKFPMAFCLVPKQVDEAKFWIAQSLDHLDKDGVLILCAANDAGGSRLKSWMEEAGLQNIQTESKNKARVVWGVRPDHLSPVLAQWQQQGGVSNHDFGPMILQTQPGIFSWDRIDTASQLLIENIPPIKGVVGDFGCGYGYLSYQVLQKNPAIQSITLVEADARALVCAEKNTGGTVSVNALWHDATKPLPGNPIFDVILMNPPFHTGKKTDTGLGQDFIRNASAHLKKNGYLYMVANTYLPYEETLQKSFSKVDSIVQKNGFKILVGRK